VKPGLLCWVVALVAANGPTLAEPKTRINSQGATIIEVYDLEENPGESCHLAEFDGRIVKRDFGDDAVSLKGITVEHDDGTREFINVEIPEGLNMALLGSVVDGLQRLSKVGRRARGRYFYCGAAGRVSYLDAIR
jgi:hypothetical protein